MPGTCVPGVDSTGRQPWGRARTVADISDTWPKERERGNKSSQEVPILGNVGCRRGRMGGVCWVS